jgi:hypothetical protein
MIFDTPDSHYTVIQVASINIRKSRAQDPLEHFSIELSMSLQRRQLQGRQWCGNAFRILGLCWRYIPRFRGISKYVTEWEKGPFRESCSSKRSNKLQSAPFPQILSHGHLAIQFPKLVSQLDSNLQIWDVDVAYSILQIQSSLNLHAKILL